MLNLSSERKYRQVVNMQIKNQLSTFRPKTVEIPKPLVYTLGRFNHILKTYKKTRRGVTAQLANENCSNA